MPQVDRPAAQPHAFGVDLPHSAGSDEDVAALKQMGVHEVMLQDTPPSAIVATLTRLVSERGQR